MDSELASCRAKLQAAEQALQGAEEELDKARQEVARLKDDLSKRGGGGPLLGQESANAVQLQELRQVLEDTRADNQRLLEERDKLMEISNQLRSDVKALGSKSMAFEGITESPAFQDALRIKERDIGVRCVNSSLAQDYVSLLSPPSPFRYQGRLDEFQETMKDLVTQNRKLKRALRDQVLHPLVYAINQQLAPLSFGTLAYRPSLLQGSRPEGLESAEAVGDAAVERAAFLRSSRDSSSGESYLSNPPPNSH